MVLILSSGKLNLLDLRLDLISISAKINQNIFVFLPNQNTWFYPFYVLPVAEDPNTRIRKNFSFLFIHTRFVGNWKKAK